MQIGTLRGARVSKKIGHECNNVQGRDREKARITFTSVGNTRAAKPLADALVCFKVWR